MEDFMDKEIKLNEDKKYKTTTNFYSKANLLNFQKVKSRNNLVKRQNQYLSAKKGGENRNNKYIINEEDMVVDEEARKEKAEKEKKELVSVLSKLWMMKN